MDDIRHADRGFAATLALSTAGVALLLAAHAHAAWIVAYVAVVQIATHLLMPAELGRGKPLLGLRVRRAMTRGEIVMHYQPKISLATGEMLGVEALARWQHPRRGLLPPVAWIAGTEFAWTERRFMSYTLDAALAQLPRWGAGDLDILLSVNVTPRCFADDRFPDLVADALRRAGVRPTQLQLELTEAALDLSPVAVEVAHRLNEMGIGLALDDFGIGHSSMERLTRLPINELKIDRRFVVHHASSPREAAIVRAAVDLGHALGLAVTAEGVENRHDIESLRRDGCDIAQGYHYAPALPADELLAWNQARPADAGEAPWERRRVPDRRLPERRAEARFVRST
jgi:EAL domain-containing protein (putative c-di-GMP-specific phosphodiesterase class I)